MDIPIWIPFQSEWWTFVMILASIPILIYISDLTLKFKVLSPEYNRRSVHFFVGILITISPFIFSEYLKIQYIPDVSEALWKELQKMLQMRFMLRVLKE